jgi:hypothetical protein
MIIRSRRKEGATIRIQKDSNEKAIKNFPAEKK